MQQTRAAHLSPLRLAAFLAALALTHRSGAMPHQLLGPCIGPGVPSVPINEATDTTPHLVIWILSSNELWSGATTADRRNRIGVLVHAFNVAFTESIQQLEHGAGYT